MSPLKHTDHERPDSDLNIPKTAKKSFINWIVPVLCAAVFMAVFTVVKSWADDRYTLRTNTDTSLAATMASILEEQKKREVLETQMQDMGRKLDLIIYILQHDGKLNSQDMKGKLSPP